MVQLITPAPSEPPLPLLGDSALLDHLRRDTVALGAAQSRMDAYCLELLRASCIASGIGDPRTDISDLLTITVDDWSLTSQTTVQELRDDTTVGIPRIL